MNALDLKSNDALKGVRGFESLTFRHKRTVRTLTIKSLGAYISFLMNISELGYWRKAYDVSDYLRQVLEIYDDFNLEDKEISYNKVVEIIDYANEQLERNKFESEYERTDWRDVVTAFTKAKEILENDPDAEIYYMEWY